MEQTPTNTNPLKDLNLTNNFMFIKTFVVPEIFEAATALLLGEKVVVPNKSSIVYEKTIAAKYNRKGVRYDVNLGNSDKLVDLEMEQLLKTNDPLDKRASIYSAHMVIDSLNKGENYKSKKDTHTIFICDFKPFNINSYHYKAQYKCKAVNTKYYVPYNTGDYHHFFNLKYRGRKIPTELKALFTYITDSTQNNVPKNSRLINMINERVQFIRDCEEMKEEYSMFNLYENEIYTQGKEEGLAQGKEEGLAQGKEEGIAQGKLSTMISIVKKGLINVKEAAKELNISEDSFISEMNKSEVLP